MGKVAENKNERQQRSLGKKSRVSRTCKLRFVEFPFCGNLFCFFEVLLNLYLQYPLLFGRINENITQ